MAALRKGDATGAPHEILDPRDLKYCRNRCGCYWEPADDPFRWRERLPLARWGFAELILLALPLLAVAILLDCTRYWYAAVVPAVPLCLVVYFFRDPRRIAPTAPDVLVAPADGKVVEITKPESAIRNENTWIGLEEESLPHRRVAIRQISGTIARRIVCDLRPGERLSRGQKIGMIKFGSRTELIIPDTYDLSIKISIGRKIKAGVTVMAKYY